MKFKVLVPFAYVSKVTGMTSFTVGDVMEADEKEMQGLLKAKFVEPLAAHSKAAKAEKAE